MNSVTQSEIAQYVEQVRAALSDLPPHERDDLLEDLPDHLAEVAAEGQGSLEARLGPPAAYAADLRASAGLSAPARENIVARVTTVVNWARRRLEQLDAKIGPILGYGTAGEFLLKIRPAWWVLRGYLAAMAVTWMLNDGSRPLGLMPRLGGSDVAAVVIVVGFILGSLWLGRRSAGLGRWPRRLVLAGGAFLVMFAFVGFVDADRQSRWTDDGVSTSYGGPYGHIEDVYVFDSSGRLLTDVRLFDQDGQPIELGYRRCDDGMDGNWSNSEWRIPVYPRCPQYAPFVVTPPSPGGQTATASPGASPSATAGPDASPSATSVPGPAPTGGAGAASSPIPGGPASPGSGGSPGPGPGAAPNTGRPSR